MYFYAVLRSARTPDSKAYVQLVVSPADAPATGHALTINQAAALIAELSQALYNVLEMDDS